MFELKIKRKNFNLSITGILLIILFLSILINNSTPMVIPASGTKADFYSIDINSTTTVKTTDGKNPVDYIITVTNTGNRQDTITLYPELLEVTGCSEPDENEWSYTLDTSLITLAPSQSVVLVLTVSTSCGCQVNCKVAIEIHAVSGSDANVHESIILYTTRGPAKKVTGLVVEIDFNSALNVIYLDQVMKFDVYIYNLQNQQDTIIVWPTEGPESWSIGVSPDEFTLQPNSKKLITLNFKVPENISSGDFYITLTAQSRDSPNIQGKDRILIEIRPDLIITHVRFSETPAYANERVKISISIQNIGLTPASDIELVVYDELNLTSEHELNRQTIPSLASNQSMTVTITWKPAKGQYNITIMIDPNDEINELTNVNNFRIEPLNVKKAAGTTTQEWLYYALIFLIILIILIWLISRYRSAGKSGGPKDQDTREPPVHEKSRLSLQERQTLPYDRKRPRTRTDEREPHQHQSRQLKRDRDK